MFNGGPGAASAFLNLGLVGPRIVEFGDRRPRRRGGAGSSTIRDTWLAFTDLVMIDPVGTGWSRTAKPDGGSAFWGVQRDAEALAKVIALYRRQEQPRAPRRNIILGESYGGFRAAKVARALQREQGIVVSGIVMVSPMLEGALHVRRHALSRSARRCNCRRWPRPSSSAQGTFSRRRWRRPSASRSTEYLTTLAGPPPTRRGRARLL